MVSNEEKTSLDFMRNSYRNMMKILYNGYTLDVDVK